jgi:hypothetical protein
MKINFFEEYPTKENLLKAKNLSSGTTVFLAAKSLEEFYILKEELILINKDVTVGYWPIAKDSYWVSPFSPESELKRIKKEISQINLPVLIDLELPFFIFKVNWHEINKLSIKKKILKEILDFDNVYSYQLPEIPIIKSLYSLLGIYFNNKNKINGLYYFSFLGPLNLLFKRMSVKAKSKNESIGIGTIGSGAIGIERNIKYSEFRNRLKIAYDLGFKEIYIFRLGGLNSNYMDSINDFS